MARHDQVRSGGRTSALGVHTVSWKAPTSVEKADDYLWRIHQAVPADGDFLIFDRSHYEDVLVPVVNELITPAQTARHCAAVAIASTFSPWRSYCSARRNLDNPSRMSCSSIAP